MHAPTKSSFCFPLVHACDFGPTLKRLSVSRCPRDDLDRIRLPDDVSKKIRTKRDWTDVPTRRYFDPGCHDLRGSDEFPDRQRVSLVVKKVGEIFITIFIAVLFSFLVLFRQCRDNQFPITFIRIIYIYIGYLTPCLKFCNTTNRRKLPKKPDSLAVNRGAYG